ncbi:PREDICTED: adenosine deaminase CECR1 [Drosophila arizonae]|uniref:adenosine deaminase n=1 Tax=Drosophila arizonae TaxID=7263 RepID=A0ABM1P8B8_DROAR|nr:PREDICTED: adenosine deaminase CECR1 [Drosophila arizonae]
MSGKVQVRLVRCMSGQAASKMNLPAALCRRLRDITPDAYGTLRKMMIQMERSSCLGSSLELTAQELAANRVLKRIKCKELETGFQNPSQFTPGHHIYDVLQKVKRSPLFRLLQDMPKGGLLHAHDTALCSTDFLIDLTYRENLWICTANEGCQAIAFRFSQSEPVLKAVADCRWQPMSEYRDQHGELKVRNYLRKRFTMYPFTNFVSTNEAWRKFMSIFTLLDGLLLHAPVWADYYYNALREMHADGVQYLELRSLIPNLYSLDGSKLSMENTVQIYKAETERFLKHHPDFIGAKLIYAPLRGVQSKVVEKYVEDCIALNKKFPNFLIGFDLVGHEEMGRPLVDFVNPLLKMPEHINFYFHSGETNWFGTSIDENLIDAILLGTKRIGHGYAVVKHPVAMELAKKLDIPIEVCPVSNQVLQLGHDYRNHPAAMLIANNVPIVIASDDPSFWHASPLTHDFYFAFLGIAPYTADLRLLKHLAMSSLKYSGLTAEEQTKALEKWKKKWDEWIACVIEKAEGYAD